MSGRDEPPRKQGDDTPQDEPFLRRWARLKKESRERPPDEAAASVAQPAEELPAAATESDEPAAPATGAPAEPESLELPSLDSLTEESDFGPFMRAGVDPALRRQALRKMFRNPKYGIVDELDPYRADFAAFTPLGDTVTADMRFHAERLLRREMERAAEAAEGAGTSSPEAAEAEPGEAAAGRAADAAAESRAGDEQTAQDNSTTRTEDDDERRDA